MPKSEPFDILLADMENRTEETETETAIAEAEVEYAATQELIDAQIALSRLRKKHFPSL